MNQRAIPLRTSRWVLNRFPENKETLWTLYRSNEDIRNIFDEVELALEALDRFKDKDDRDNRRVIEDYLAVIEDLGGEIGNILRRYSAKSRY